LNAIRINLPAKYFYVNTPHSGVEWFGGKADQMTLLVRAVDLTARQPRRSLLDLVDIEPTGLWFVRFRQMTEPPGLTAIDGKL